MTTHTLHGEIMDHGLWPGCPRCIELAQHPTMAALDMPNRERLLRGELHTPLDAEALWHLREAMGESG